MAAPKKFAEALNATKDATRESFWVEPGALKLGRNSRGVEPDHQVKVEAKIESIKQQGQLQPCLVRRLPGGELELIAGFTRHEAVTWLGDRKLLVQLVEAETELQAFIASVLENVRDNPNALSVAQAQAWLLEQGMSKTEVSALYGYNNTNALARGQKLLSLDPRLQALVAAGTLSVDAALKTAELPPVKQDKLIAEAESGAKVTSNAVADTAEAAEGDGEGDTDEALAKKLSPRNAAAVKKLLLENVLHEGSGIAEDLQEVFRALVGFIEGTNANKKFLNKLRAL